MSLAFSWAFPGSHRMNSRVRRLGARGAAFARGWRSPRRRHALPIVITSFLGVAFSVAGSHAIFHWAERAAELELSARGNNITGTLQTGIDEYLDRVAALRAFFKSIRARCPPRRVHRIRAGSVARSIRDPQPVVGSSRLAR
jgi:hypothetical protein